MDYSSQIGMSWQCAGCGRAVRAGAFSVVDATARPDLLRAAVDGTLNALRCPGCGTVQEAELPLLVYNGNGYPQVLAFHSSLTAPEQDEENERALLELLLSRMGPVTAEHAADSPVVRLPMEMLPVMLSPLLDDGDPDGDDRGDGGRRRDVSGTFRDKTRGAGPSAEVRDLLTRLVELGTPPLGRSLADEPRAREVVRLARAGLALAEVRADPSLRAMLRLELGKGLSISTEGRNPLANVEQAIGELGRAGEDLTAERHAGVRAVVRFELGRTYRRRMIGDPVLNYAIAADHLRAARDVATAEGDHRLWADAQSTLGCILMERGSQLGPDDVEEGIRLLEEVVERLDVSEARELWCDTVSHLAAGYGMRQRGDRAVNLERALELYERLDAVESASTDPEQWANTQARLAVLLMKRLRGTKADNHRRARAHLLAALQVYEDVGDGGEASSTRDKLALAAKGLGEHAEALRWLREALASRPREAMPRLWARTQLKLGTLLLDHPEARPDVPAAEARRAGLRAVEDAVAAHDALPAGLEHGIADHTLAQSRRRYRLHLVAAGGAAGEIAELLAGEIAALERAAAQLRGRTDMYGHACEALGDARADAGDWPGSAAAFEAAVDVADEEYRACLLRTSRESQLTGAGDLHQRAAYAMARAGRAADAVRCLERGRARGFGEELSPDRDQLRRAASIDADACREYELAADALRLVYARSWALTRPDAGDDERGLEAAEAALAGAIERARADLDAAVTRVRSLPGLGSFLAAPADQAGEPDGSEGPVCYLAATRWGSVCLSPGPGRAGDPGPRVEWADLTVDEARDAARALAAGPDTAHRALPGLLAELAGRLTAAVTAVLEPGQAVVLVPCGVLAHLPLHAVGAPDEPLLARHAVSYAPSRRMLLAARARLPRAQAPDAAPAPAVLVTAAGPDHGLLTREETGLLGGLAAAAGGRCHVARDTADLLDVLPAATYVHLAGHGDFDPADPLSSGVDVGAGRITLAELIDPGARPLWQARLVTLSACRTAVVDDELPDEAIGLPAGILLAGGAGVVCTLWEAHDVPALLLMTDLYRRVLGTAGSAPVPPGRALCDAQQWLAAAPLEELLALPWLPAAARERLSGPGVPGRPFGHPYFWAPFVLVGV